MNRKYTIKNIARALRNPGRIVGEMRRIAAEINKQFQTKKPRGEAIFKKDWDMLIILDGCRYDLFDKETELEGKTSAVTSRGSESEEFMNQNFTGNQHFDTVYISANPYTYKVRQGVFYNVYDVSQTHWDASLSTVPPESVTNLTLEVADEFPNKRIIAHYMQPHYPFIGKLGQSIDSGGINESEADIWTLLQNNRCPVGEETVWEAYAENYRVVEPHIRRIWDQTIGKTVVTADHGNLIGERISPIPVRYYGHPPRVRHPKLITVPWHILPVDNRRKITTDPPIKQKKKQANNEEQIRKRLSALGYD